MSKEFYKRSWQFAEEARKILGNHASLKYKVLHLEESYRELSTISLKQDDLFRQALRCLENELFRAAHVMAWAGFVDYIEQKLAENDFKSLRETRPKWVCNSVVELRENYPEHQILEVLRDIGLASKTETKALLGLLNKRNECAHPSDYYPGPLDTLGYIDEILKRLKSIENNCGTTSTQ